MFPTRQIVFFGTFAIAAASLAVSSNVPCLAANQASAVNYEMKRGFMLGPGPDTAYLNDQVKDLYGSGARIVRYPIYFDFESSPNTWIARINFLLDMCDRDCPGMTVVIDVHHPGSTAATCNVIAKNDDFVRLWQRLASSFKNRPVGRVWFDILNEPGLSYNGEAWSSFALRIARQIRAVDPVHPIVYAVPGDRTTLITRKSPNFDPLPGISNQVIEVHFWDWAGTESNPDVQWPYETGAIPHYGVSPRSKIELQTIFEKLAAWGRTKNVQLYIGEVGINEAQPGASEFLKDFTDLANQYRISTTLHAYEEASVWNYELNSQAWNVILNWLDPTAKYAVDPASTYSIVSMWNGKCIDIYCNNGPVNAAILQEWDNIGGPNQRWRIQPMGNGNYEIISVWTGKCIDLRSNNGPINGAPLQEWDYLSTPNQKWQLQAAGNGYYAIVSKWSGKCIDIYCNNGPINGAILQEWDNIGGPNQRWKFTAAR